jgi:putative phosphoesterase
MRIAVISDTHDRIPPELPGLIVRSDAIWHLGDVCTQSVFDRLAYLGPPIRVVRGNCDLVNHWPLVVDLREAGLRIRLMHVPPRMPVQDVDIIIHGHTHKPRNERMGTVLILNPGCITRPPRGVPPSFAWLTLETGRPPCWELMRLK